MATHDENKVGASLVVDHRAHITWVSPAVSQLLGANVAALLGQPLHVLDPRMTFPDDPGVSVSTIAQQARRRALPAGRSFRVVPQRDGAVGTWRLKAAVMQGAADDDQVVLHIYRAAAFQEGPEWLQAIAQRIDEVFWLRSAEQVMYVSPAYETVWGRSVDSLYADPSSLLAAVHPDERAALTERFHAAMREGTALEVACRIQRPDGAVRWLQIKHVPVETAHPSPRYAGIARDVTEKRRAEHALRASEERFQHLILNAQPIIFMINRDGTFVLSEGLGLRKLGLRAGEAVGQSAFAMYADHPDIVEAIERALAGEKVENTSVVNGVRFDTWYSPYYDTDDTVAGCIGMAIDVTERERAAQRIRDHEARYRLLAENARDLIWTVDTDFDFTFVSPAAERLYGYAPNELMAMRWDDLVLPSSRDTVQKARALRARYDAEDAHDRRSIRIEIEQRRKDGATLWVEVVTTPLYDAGERIGYLGVTRNITERKQTEAALAGSRALLEATQRITRTGGWEIDAATRAVTWTRELRRLLDVPPNQTLRYEEALAMYTDAARPTVEAAFEAALDTGAPFEYEAEVRTAAGRRRWVKVVGEADVVDGAVRRLRGTLQDVTTERARRQRLTLLESAVKNANDIVILTEAGILDEPGPRIEYVNDAFVEQTGYTRAEALGRSPRFLQGADTDRAALDRVRAALEAGQPVREELINYRKDGTPYWVELNIVPVRQTGGRITHFVSVQRNATERKRAEQALQRSEERFRAVSEQAIDVVAIFDGAGAFTYLSPSVEEVTGAPRDALVGQDGFARVHPDDVEAARAAFAQAIEHPGTTSEVQARYRHRDGSWRHLSIRGRRLPSTGEAVEVLANVRDVTERIRREQELVAAKERAEEMSRIKSAFLANMSHEIRTPLTAIIGFADVLGDHVDGTAQELLDMIRASGKRLEETLTSVLHLAKIEGESVEFRPERIRLDETTRGAADLLRPKAEAKGIRLVVDAAPMEASVDTAAYQRIVTNLVSNAIKFTEAGAVTVRLRCQDGEACLQVEDTGIGIQDDHVARVFTEFAQESEGYTRDFEGVGLGLTITKRLVELHDGTIRVESEKGVGSVFTVVLPGACTTRADDRDAPAATDAAPARRDATPDPPRGHVDILLVEDNELTRTVLPMLLQRADGRYAMDCATSPDDALAMAATKRYDLFLIDVNLSAERSGIDVMRQLRAAAPRYAQAPMVACTAYAMPGDGEAFLEAGFDAYLPKPFRARELLDVLRRVER